MSRLFSQSRQISVWFSGPSKISYIIPLYSSLESSLGANLELSLDLHKSYHYHSRLRDILHIHPEAPLPYSPQNQTPLLLDFHIQKTKWKTTVEGKEVSQPQEELCLEQVSAKNIF